MKKGITTNEGVRRRIRMANDTIDMVMELSDMGVVEHKGNNAASSIMKVEIDGLRAQVDRLEWFCDMWGEVRKAQSESGKECSSK